MHPTQRRLINVLVPVKRAIDYAVKIRIAPDGKGVDASAKHSMNPFDEIAVEEALRLRERSPKGLITSITALTIGPTKSVETLRTALAMGADDGVHVVLPDGGPASPEPLGVARAVQAIVERRKIDLVILGKQAIDDDSGATGGMVAGLLGWGQGTFASKLEVQEGGEVTVTREIDGGLEKIKGKLPMVITTDLRLNEPRYASLPNIMKAKKKKVETLKPEDLGLDFTPDMEVLGVTEPPKRVGGGKVESIDELVAKLKDGGLL